jgi:hypothetical protein
MGSRTVSKKQSEQIANGVFLIGLAILFMPNGIGFWPGILFVIGASGIARSLARGRTWFYDQGALWMIGLGLMFWFGFSVPLLLILGGLAMIVGYTYLPSNKPEDCCPSDDLVIEHKPRNSRRKIKNEETGLEYYDLEPCEEADYI